MKRYVFTRLVTVEDMPPGGALRPSAAERAMVGNRMIGGAP